ncbi:16S rRNA (guanine(966)-N(2))-methyltransferase RsmD [Ramlibacter montanisoli]|uniref:16S rRNA (Guanine(966)-N(2))-methyltransferase RsmD n=1 Tax=Ramlibacter montanisoli TaxID=2732512 RepID=A0A849KII0_9BURK|nr:16S rRNA (guanine(966)-N(2))-methyltransferase RsmD [Ramlibacter montanisoli]NNU44391.1 16S rRNA (guanine(966)-N(2))-methyltransferase RsmD [Ramlibacter montanisoli]
MPRTAPPARRGLPNQVRIIGGLWKRTPLPVADRPGLRPTPDRVRETLFNWLGQDLSGWHCVDAFAGTGALGLEAASRGAGDVLLVETEGALVDQLRGIVKKLAAGNVRVQRGNALSVLAAQPAASLDLVFLDPPFDAGLFDKALAAARPALREQGFLYLEAPTEWQDEALARHRLERVRHMRAGAVHGHLLRPAA